MISLQSLFRQFYDASCGSRIIQVDAFNRLVDYISTHHSHFVFDDPIIPPSMEQHDGGEVAVVCERGKRWRYLVVGF
jgi:hypothetical protein